VKRKPKEVAAWAEEKVVEIPPPYRCKIVEVFPRIKVKVPFRKKVKLADGEEIVLSEETLAIVTTEHKTKECFMCGFILEDFAANGKLTGYPNDMFGKGTFPVESKIRHIEILKYNLPGKVERGAKPPAPEEHKEESDVD
jgi:hypothetical protein